MKEQSGHVTAEKLKAWTEGRLSAAEERQMLEHIGGCNYCAEQMAQFLEGDPAEPPAYLQEEIMERSRQPDVRTARTIYETSKHMRLLVYSLKVGLAVAFSLFLLFFMPELERMKALSGQSFTERSRLSITEKLEEKSSRVNSYFQDITGRLFHMEEEYND